MNEITDEEKEIEKERIKAAIDMALIMFGKSEIDNARGDEKMIEDGKKHIKEGFERIDKDFPSKRDKK